MTRVRKIAASLAAAVVLAAAPGRADDSSELERAKTSYDAGRYAEGAERFGEILAAGSPNTLRERPAIERARAYYAACLIALGRSDEADTQIEALIRMNPLYSPDPVVFPGKVIDRFIDVKSRLRAEIEEAQRARSEAERSARAKLDKEQRAYLDMLQRMAKEETVVVRHSRAIAMLPFGAGQFQNGQDGLGYAFLFTEALLGGASIVAGVVHMQLVSDYAKFQTSVDSADFESRRLAMRDISVYSTGALAVIAAVGIVQAQLTFVPEVRETRARPLPKAPAVTPTVSPGPTGFAVGVSGAF